jgi:hypothetical protein
MGGLPIIPDWDDRSWREAKRNAASSFRTSQARAGIYHVRHKLLRAPTAPQTTLI